MNPLQELIHRPRPGIWAQFRQAPIAFLARKLWAFSQSLNNNFRAQQPQSESRPHPHAISVVCISDTHNNQPDLPDGDILIHAGDLTQSGTFDEIQATLKWLNAQPHPHKIVVAGNHDLLLDRWLDRIQWRTELRDNLNWGDIIYLENTSTTVTVHFPSDAEPETLKIFGSPLSPKHGNWAFQYPRDENCWGYYHEPEPGSDSETAWGCIIPHRTDILITHCPPQTHLDTGNLGCVHLLRALWGLPNKPALHVFGHIHAGYGVEKVGWDNVQEAYERCLLAENGHGGKGIGNLFKLVMALFVQVIGGTLMVNAAIIGGLKDDEQRSPFKVWL
ncbi:Metallo-dependent phosphatase-like protein [Naviculisporaceae sp. PSN 640]